MHVGFPACAAKELLLLSVFYVICLRTYARSESDGIITCSIYPEVPLRSEYAFSYQENCKRPVPGAMVE